MDKKILLTREGYEELASELEQLKTQSRPDMLKQVEHSRALGDLRENEAYQAARNKLSFIQGRIEELEEILDKAEVYEPKDGEKSDKVRIGSCVEVEVDGEIREFRMVDEKEADIQSAKISSSSPLGSFMLGKKVGDTFNVEAPAGMIEYRIISIS